MKNAEPERHRIFRDPAGTIHALAGTLPSERMGSVLITLCALGVLPQAATPMDGARAEVTCAECVAKLAAGW